MSVNREELKKQLIEELNLEELTIVDIADDDKLFGDDGLGLDSIDALELIVLLEKYYGIKVTDPKEAKEVFESISTMASYIEKNT
ncbi:MAG: acyl carrier protein [Bacteroidetes bacterium]|nr:acyl carrier protein [Bacteroidota bacterium]